MDLEILDNLINDIKESDSVQNFVKKLSDFLENNNDNKINKVSKYSKYWNYKNFMEDNVAANIGISKWSADVSYRAELSDAIDSSILELSKTEGTLYRKQFSANGPTDNPIYNIDKFENGKIEHLTLLADKVPKGFENEDIIFQYKADGNIKVRTELKEKAVEFATERTKYLKVKENEQVSDYKHEGHIYKAIEDDGYIFLKDLTEPRGYLVEDIDFIVEHYKGEGKYQVIDGEYKKIIE